MKLDRCHPFVSSFSNGFTFLWSPASLPESFKERNFTVFAPSVLNGTGGIDNPAFFKNVFKDLQFNRPGINKYSITLISEIIALVYYTINSELKKQVSSKFTSSPSLWRGESITLLTSLLNREVNKYMARFIGIKTESFLYKNNQSFFKNLEFAIELTLTLQALAISTQVQLSVSTSDSKLSKNFNVFNSKQAALIVNNPLLNPAKPDKTLVFISQTYDLVMQVQVVAKELGNVISYTFATSFLFKLQLKFLAVLMVFEVSDLKQTSQLFWKTYSLNLKLLNKAFYNINADNNSQTINNRSFAEKLLSDIRYLNNGLLYETTQLENQVEQVLFKLYKVMGLWLSNEARIKSVPWPNLDQAQSYEDLSKSLLARTKQVQVYRILLQYLKVTLSCDPSMFKKGIKTTFLHIATAL